MSDDDLIRRGDAEKAVMGLWEFDSEGWVLSRPNYIQVQDAIRALPAATGWQDIATAPKDGTRFFASGGGLDDVDICSYNARIGCWDCGGVTLDDTDREPEGYNRPTHWQPLPGPPA